MQLGQSTSNVALVNVQTTAMWFRDSSTGPHVEQKTRAAAEAIDSRPPEVNVGENRAAYLMIEW
jgi:hypothetical protein